jgi:signal transduction histidine kinase
LTILLVEDNPADRRLVRETVAETAGGAALVEILDCDRLSEAKRRLAGTTTDCVLLDLSLPDASGIQAVREIHDVAPHVPVVVLSGLDDEQAAVAALHSGAQDYLLKGESDGRLILRSIRYAIERKRAELEQEATQAALRRSERRQREILAGILQAEETERSRIATALHDDTVQVMTASLIALDRLALVARESRNQRIESAVMFARATLEEATDRTRRLMFELRPAILHERGLRAAIGILTEQMARETGARSVVSGEVGRYDHHVEELVYRSAQEALSNVRKHAHPSTITVVLDDSDQVLVCEISDDGRGFDPDDVRSRPQAAFHLGLDTLTERVRAAGGDVTIESRPGAGTRIAVRLPAVPARPGGTGA